MDPPLGWSGQKQTRGPKGQNCAHEHFALEWNTCWLWMISPKNTNLVDDVEYLPPVKFCSIPFSSCREEVEIFQQIRGLNNNLCFAIGQKTTNLVEDVEILLPVKFCLIPLHGCRKEVEYVSANQRPGWPSLISDQLEKNKLGRGCWDLASCQVSLKRNI